MAYCDLLPLSFLLLTSFSYVYSQITVATNIFDTLDKYGCTQFKSIILAAKLEERYKGVVPTTLFVFNDTTYAALPSSRVGNLYENNERGPRNYVRAFTLDQVLDTSSFDARAYRNELSNEGYLFLNRKQLRSGNVASGTPGPTQYFVNGAIVTTANIRAGQHIMHIIDRVLDMPLQSNALSYADDGNVKLQQFKFYKLLMKTLSQTSTTDSEENYNTQVRRVLQSDQVTFFLPSDAAMSEIPSQKLSELQGNHEKLLEIVCLHIVPGQVIYTSLVNHNEPFVSQKKAGKVIFRKNFDREAVYITGALRGGTTVTSRIAPANITVRNGVVHHIDQVLGFVYKSAIEEITTELDSNNFERVINAARKDLQNTLSMPSGVTVFAPTNNAMLAVSNVYENYITNQSLINRVLQLSMLMPGEEFSLTSYNRGYRSMIMKESMYNGRMIKIYSEGNDTWVEGGYVRARVIKPDIGVTNGLVHQIDAVFGVPTRDVPYTIFCNDWLTRTFEQLEYVKLDEYMRDSKLVKNQQCSHQSGIIGSPAGDVNTITTNICGDAYYRCQFTAFVPNGTAIDRLFRIQSGRNVMMNDPRRWKWILRRHISRRSVIYLDQLAVGAPHRYIADNGEEVEIVISGQNQFASSHRTAYLRFENMRVEILRSDIGATNGVIHIIDNVMFTQDDLSRDVSKAAAIDVPIVTLFLLTVLSVLSLLYHL